MQAPLKPKAATAQTVTLLLSEQGTKIDKTTEVANTLMARDYKGFGNQPMNAVMEVKGIAMSDKCEQVGVLQGGKWDKMYDISKRVYSDEGTSPTLHTCGGDNCEPKILDTALAYDEQNGILREDGTVGTLTTDGSSPKHNNRVVEPTYRVRKLTERECGKLMGVKTCDIKKIGKNLSKSAQYHCFGDSIVTTVLMAIFGQMLDIDYEQKIRKLSKELSESK